MKATKLKKPKNNAAVTAGTLIVMTFGSSVDTNIAEDAVYAEAAEDIRHTIIN